MRVMQSAGCSILVLFAVAGLRAATPDLALLEAIKNQNHDAVRTLIAGGADVNATQPDGATALHWAAYRDDVDAVDRLLKAGARVGAKNELGATPLWLACLNGNAVIAERLLAAGADANAALDEGETPLMTAARTGNPETVEALLTHGANPNAVEKVRGQTALMWAAAEHHPAVVQALIRHGADINARSLVRSRPVKIKGTDTRSATVGVEEQELGGFSALLFAAREGDLPSAKLLVEAGADLNQTAPNGANVLVVATHSGHPALTDWLLTKGADPNTTGAGYTALHVAVLRGDVAAVKSLLAHGAKPNIALLRGTAVRAKSMDWAMAGSWTGATPFWMAAKFAEVEIMRLLLIAGADPKLASKDGSTPMMAAIAGTVDRWGNDTATAGYINKMPEAADEDRMILSALAVLADLGADINATDQNGDTALHRAAARRLEAVVTFLAGHGANVNAKNKRGQTPIELTTPARRQFTEMGDGRSGPKTAELLKKFGATD
jgi:ankyrin repeat protein